MKMNTEKQNSVAEIEERFGKRIAQFLDSQSQNLSGDIQDRLSQARALAISRAKPEPDPVFAAQWQTAHRGFSIPQFNTPIWSFTSWLIPIAVVMFGLIAITKWQEDLRIQDIAIVDIALLTDDVPPDAFMDNGFMAFLKLKTVTKPEVDEKKVEDEKI